MGDHRKGDQNGSSTSGADSLISLSRSGVLDARSRIKYERWCGPSTRRAEGIEGYSYSLTIGFEGDTK